MRDKKGSEETERSAAGWKRYISEGETCGKIVRTTGMLMRQYESH